MPISKFSFYNEFQGWRLEDVCFSDFNLLVGKSGVGKTKILDALFSVCQVESPSDWSRLNGCSWRLEFEIDEGRYVWEATTSRVSADIREFAGGSNGARHPDPPVYLQETLIKNGQQTLFLRDSNKFIFLAAELPKIKNTESAISLFNREAAIAPISKVLKKVLFREKWEPEFSIASWTDYSMPDGEFIESWLNNCPTLDSMREEPNDPMIYRIFILQQCFPQEFDWVKKSFQEIFPSVIDMKLGALSEFFNTLLPEYPRADMLVLGMKEVGVRNWVLPRQFSSGMLRTLNYLFELSLAPKGAVIVIDEIENSLGVNCLSSLIDHLLRRNDLQVILTSHHPYVINNIPWKYWKLVTRKGSEITVKDAAEIPSLNSASSLEKFTQLMNLEEYEEAIR